MFLNSKPLFPPKCYRFKNDDCSIIWPYQWFGLSAIIIHFLVNIKSSFWNKIITGHYARIVKFNCRLKVDGAFFDNHIFYFAHDFSFCWNLTHWDQVTHICVSKLTMIGSDNGLPPGRRQAIIWTNVGILLIGTPFSEILIEIHSFSFKKMG